MSVNLGSRMGTSPLPGHAPAVPAAVPEQRPSQAVLQTSAHPLAQLPAAPIHTGPTGFSQDASAAALHFCREQHVTTAASIQAGLNPSPKEAWEFLQSARQLSGLPASSMQALIERNADLALLQRVANSQA